MGLPNAAAIAIIGLQIRVVSNWAFMDRANKIHNGHAVCAPILLTRAVAKAPRQGRAAGDHHNQRRIVVAAS